MSTWSQKIGKINSDHRNAIKNIKNDIINKIKHTTDELDAKMSDELNKKQQISIQEAWMLERNIIIKYNNLRASQTQNLYNQKAFWDYRMIEDHLNTLVQSIETLENEFNKSNKKCKLTSVDSAIELAALYADIYKNENPNERANILKQFFEKSTQTMELLTKDTKMLTPKLGAASRVGSALKGLACAILTFVTAILWIAPVVFALCIYNGSFDKYVEKGIVHSSGKLYKASCKYFKECWSGEKTPPSEMIKLKEAVSSLEEKTREISNKIPANYSINSNTMFAQTPSSKATNLDNDNITPSPYSQK